MASSLHRRLVEPSGPARATVVLHHGFGEHGGLYEETCARFAAAGFRASIHDARGHGLSAGQRGFVEAWSELRDDLEAQVDRAQAEAPELPLFLFGASLGGAVVLDGALRRPSGLAGVICCGPALGAVGVPLPLLLLARLLSRVWPRFSLESRLDLSNLSRDREAARKIVEDPLFHQKGTPRLSTEYEATVAFIRTHATELAVPSLFLHGTADRIADPRATQAVFESIARDGPGGSRHELKLYDGAVHNLLADTCKEHVYADVLSWLQSHSEARGLVR